MFWYRSDNMFSMAADDAGEVL